MSLFFQIGALLGMSASLGIAVLWFPEIGVLLALFLALLLFTRWILSDYSILLALIVLVIPFNFEGLIAQINIPYLNPFNLLWLSYVGIVFFRAALYSEPILVRSPLNIPIFLVIVSFSIAFFQSAYVIDSYRWKTHVFPIFQQWLQWILFYFFCMKGIRSEQEAKRVIFWILTMVAFAGLQNIRDYLGMIALTKGDNLERASGLFSNANYSASFFCYYTPVAVGLALATWKNYRWQLFFYACAGSGLIAVVVTYSRGGMAAVGVACLLIAAFSKIKPSLIVVVLILIVTAGSSENIRKRFSETSQPGPYGPVVDPSVEARLIAWQKAYHLIQERPFLGSGFFTFRYIQVEKYEDDAARAHGHRGMAVHNGFLNILVNAGIFGFSTFLLLVFSILKQTWGAFRSIPDPYWKGVALGLFAGMISLLLVNMSGTRLYDRQMVGYLWILLAAFFQGIHHSQNPTTNQK